MSPRYDVPKAAPQPLRLVQRFVNTASVEHEREWLETPADLEAWLADVRLELEGDATDADLERARELREALRSLLVAQSRGATPSPETIATVNRAASAGRLALELDGRGAIALDTYGRGVDAALARIVATAFAAMLDGSWDRLKTCRNCQWAFYDYSRNRAASWCSMTLCGNRLKTRRYRRRRAETG